MSVSNQKARYWVAVLYNENMRADWQIEIGDLLAQPYAYCVHDKDSDSEQEHRKTHTHIMLAFPNTTTYNNAMQLFNKLSAEGKKALNKIEAVSNVRNMYEYLIHNTETCVKKDKHLYDKSERVTGNNFDIGNYEQLGIAEKNVMLKELCDLIFEHNFTNFGDFYIFATRHYEDSNYFDLIKTYNGLLERLVRSNYQKMWVAKEKGTAFLEE